MSNRLSVLVIEDDRGDFELLRRTLQSVPDWQLTIQHACDMPGARPILARDEINFIFLDNLLGAENGEAILRELRSAGEIRPIVIVTGHGDEQTAANLMRSGADDYLIKGTADAIAMRRALLAALAQYARRLAEARNRELLESLQIAKTRLEYQNRRLAGLYETAHQFVDHVSHEFRTPLTVIKEFAAIMRDGLAGGPVNSEQLEYCGIIVNRVDDLSVLIDDMLDISRLEAGMLGLHRGDCTLKEIMERVEPTLRCRAQVMRASVEIDFPDTLGPVFCDPDKVARVILNLVINALKFAGEGARIVVSAKLAESKREIAISVGDNGPGIDAEALNRLFDRFQQAECGLRAAVKGFGLGLSIVRALVTLNLGELTVASTRGVGSTFSFTLPCAAREALVRTYLERVDRFRGPVPRASLVSLTIGEPADSSQLSDLATIVQQRTRSSDLLVRSEAQRWILVVAAGHVDVAPILERIGQAIVEGNRNRMNSPLPHLEARVTGCWDLRDASEEFVDQFVRACEPLELSNAGQATHSDR